MVRLPLRLSLPALIRSYWRPIALIFLLTVIETALFAFLPLLIGRSIDGFLSDSWGAFYALLPVLAALPAVAIARSIYDARAYGKMRVELGIAQVARASDEQLSVVNAQVLMGRELVDFLEFQAPESVTALIQVLISIVILSSFNGALALSTGGATIVILVTYWCVRGRFFRLNSSLNEQAEKQISTLEHGNIRNITAHFVSLRKHEVRMSDTESWVYGAIFLVLLMMLAFNLWFAATQSGATTGQIFSIVSYSYEFVQSAFLLPLALQALTRLSEISGRISPGVAKVPEEGA